MKRSIATAMMVAALVWPWPPLAQGTPDLERLVEDAIEAPAAAQADEPLAAQIDLMTAAEIDGLVAPVALYPDSLLAQVLVASTFPLEIVQADRILADSADKTDAEVTEAIDARDWDPSVLVLLTGFPDVIRRMAEDLDDTERLGVAMAQQDQDVLDSVQRLRAQAETTGWLADNEAQIVERVDDRIVIEPADPEVVYVPRYDERRAFATAPTSAPVVLQPGAAQQGFNPLLAGAIGFGSALLVNEMFGDDDSDNDKNGWDDYWRKDRRAIDWSDRQVYPRAGHWDDDGLRRGAAWSRERDRYWDRGQKRWRADHRANQSERRRNGDWVVRRDKNGKAEVRLKDWSDVRAAIERDDRRDRTQRVKEADRKSGAAAKARADRRKAAQRDRAREERQGARAAEARRDNASDRQAAAAAERKREQRREKAASNGGKANSDKALLVRADAAKDRQKAKAAAEKRKASRHAASKRAPKAQEPKAAVKRQAAKAEKPQGKAVKTAQAKKKKKKKRCANGKGKDCRPGR